MSDWIHDHAQTLVDAAVVAALTVLATTALLGTFDSPLFLLASAVGALVGLGAVAAGRAVRRPWLVAPALAALLVLLLGPVLTLRGTPAGPLPTPGAWTAVAHGVVRGWKELLTTLPPLAWDGPNALLPLAIAVVGSGIGYALARGTDRPFLPVAGPVLALAAATALGLPDAPGTLARGLGFAIGLVGWGAARARRSTVTSGEHWQNLLGGVGLLAATGVVVALLAPALGVLPQERLVLRDRVVAPVELAEQTSPLAGFRRLTPARAQLADHTLMTVHGLPAGTPVRLAVLDSYSGQVWAAGDTTAAAGDFLRVGTRIPTSTTGDSLRATVTIGPGIAELPGLRSWLPGVGSLTQVRFTGPDAYTRTDALRYSPRTGAAIVLGGVRPGDQYEITAIRPTTPRATALDAVPPPRTAEADAAVTSRFVAAAAAGRAGQIEQIRAVAARLRTTGAYTDGTAHEGRYAPGHGVGRLTTFLGAREPAGNDEQYAAAMALAANQVGLPARIVLAAIPEPDGRVLGRDVRADVEVQTGPDTWWTLSPADFMPPRTKHPHPESSTQRQDTENALVPPPNAQRPPSSTDQIIIDSSSSARGRTTVADAPAELPAWVVLSGITVGTPLALVALWGLLMALTKGLRRYRRRHAAAPLRVVDGSWAELLDTLEDHGLPAARRGTRTEAAHLSGITAAGPVARYADTLTFGPHPPTAEEAGLLWDRVAAVRAEVRASADLRTRVRALLSADTVMPRRERGQDPAAPSSRYRSVVAAPETT